MMSEKVLITGASGFFGRHICRYLSAVKPWTTIVGVDLCDSSVEGCSEFCTIDLTSADQTAALIERIHPDYIIHLAGIFGQDNVEAIMRVNVLSITTLLEAARRYANNVVIVAIGSAAEYGLIDPSHLPITELTSCRPITVYGLSKQLAGQVAEYYHRVHKMCVMIVRPFQLIGKGGSTRLAPGAFAEQLRQAIKEGTNTIKVGNLESERDFLDVDDAADAIWKLCRKPAVGNIFNLCSGRPVKMTDLLSMMIDSTEADIRVEVDPARLRGSADANRVFGSYAKLEKHCGWKPTTLLDRSVKKMFQK